MGCGQHVVDHDEGTSSTQILARQYPNRETRASTVVRDADNIGRRVNARITPDRLAHQLRDGSAYRATLDLQYPAAILDAVRAGPPQSGTFVLVPDVKPAIHHDEG